MNNLINTRIEQYEIKSRLGEGGMAVVFKAQDLNLDRTVALKVIHPQVVSDPEAEVRFRQEARAIANLHHPSIVTVHYFGSSQGLLYMVMSYVEGGSLSAYLRQMHQSGQVVELREILLFLAQVADALGYAHRRGVIHRDIKPSNILIQRQDVPDREGEQSQRAVVSDFGLVKLLEGGVETKRDALLGTYPYMSPEQCLQKPIDGRSDLYSLGVVFYQSMTGEFPYKIHSATDAVLKHHTGAKPVPPRQVRPELPVIVEEIINKAIARNPADRYQTGEEMAAALREAARSVPADDITQFESLGTVKSLSTSLASSAEAEPSRMGFDLPATSPGVRLVVAQKEHTPRSIPLTKTVITIGRGDDNDVVLENNDVSRHHARLELTSESCQVIDLDSKNHTYLEGQPLLPNIPEEFLPETTLRIGPYLIHWQRTSGAAEHKAQPKVLLGSIGVNIQPSSADVMPGGSVRLEAQLFNDQAQVDHLRLHVEGLRREWYSIPTPVLELMPRKRGALIVEIHPPMNASARAGAHPYQLVVTSETDKRVSERVPGQINVQPFEHFLADIQPSQLADGRIATVTIRNEGNAEGVFSLSGRDPAHAVRFAGPQGQFRVAAGATVKQQMQVAALERPLIGIRQMLPFEIAVTSATQSQQVLPGQMRVAPVIPMWMVPLVGILCSLCFLVGRWSYQQLVVYPSETAIAATATFDALVGLEGQKATQTAQTATSAMLTASAENINRTQTAETAIANEHATQTHLANANIETQTAATANALATISAEESAHASATAAQQALYMTETAQAIGTAQSDVDQDGLTYEKEKSLGTDPNLPDTDGDGINDGDEVRNSTDPLTPRINGFVGIWISVNQVPNAQRVSNAISRLEIRKVDQDTVTFSVCRCESDACQEQIRLDPAKVTANLTGDQLVADLPFYPNENHTWTLTITSLGKNLFVTINEKLPEGSNPVEPFEMKLKPRTPGDDMFDPCSRPIYTHQ